VTDDTGPSTLAGAITVDANSTVTTVAPAAITQGAPNTVTTVAITGSGFVAGAHVYFTNTTDGTTLASTDVAGTIATSNTGGIVTSASPNGQGTATESGVGGTTLTVQVSATNSITGATEAAGTYNVTVVNPDGGTTVDAAAFTVIPYGVTNVSPSAVLGTVTSTNTTVTIAGAGFEPGAQVSLSGCSEANGGLTTALATSSVVSASSITAVVPESGTATQLCNVTVVNPSPTNGGNGASFILTGGLGIAGPSTVAPTITATSATTPINPGASSTTVTFTGTGFSQYSTAAAFEGTSSTVAAPGVTLSNPSGNTGTSVTFNVSVAGTGATAGPDGVQISNSGNGGNIFPAGISVAGPVITSQAPTGIAVSAAVGTVITLTGTGFTNTTSGSVATAGGSLRGIVSYLTATTMQLVLTASPNNTDLATPPSVDLSQVVAGGTVSSTPFPLTIDAAPLVSNLTYTVGSDVGVGATAQQVVIHGSGFAAGATVGSFVNGNSVADPDVTATVTSVNAAGTEITASIAIAAGDVNIADGYTVTNTDGGVAHVAATLVALVIGAGPTVTAVSPATGLESATTAFTLTGTGFQTGATVAATSDGTCGSADVVSATSITVSCTLGAAQTTAVSLAVTNPDGGSATSAVVLPAVSTKAPAKPFHLSAVHGHAVAGKTVSLTITGSGFHGQPHITSSAGGKSVVSKDTGSALVVRVTTSASTKPGVKTFTVSQGAKSAKIHYTVVK
jgi:hypothetical protein